MITTTITLLMMMATGEYLLIATMQSRLRFVLSRQLCDQDRNSSVGSVLGSVLLDAASWVRYSFGEDFSGRGDFTLELTWVLTPFPL